MTKRSSLAGRRVQRMNGAGNKILVLDLRDGSAPPSPEEARAIHEARGLDYDQLMTLTPARRSDTLAYVLIYNNDGSLSGACGNGARCVADRLARETGTDAFAIETERGRIACERVGEWVYRVDMGAPRLGAEDIPFADASADTRAALISGAEAYGPAGLVNMGNPHAVFFLTDVAKVNLAEAGPPIERNRLFSEKVNVSFAQILAPRRIRLKVWERGVGATLACGSAACATLVAAVRRGLAEREATVELPGGELVVAWRADNAPVLMTGPVVFEREIELTRAALAA